MFQNVGQQVDFRFFKSVFVIDSDSDYVFNENGYILMRNCKYKIFSIILCKYTASFQFVQIRWKNYFLNLYLLINLITLIKHI